MALRERIRLIVITDRGIAAPRAVVRIVEGALKGGAPAIQLRNKGASPHTLFEEARHLRSLTSAYGALLFVNDRIDVALAAGADGVHLGPDDITVAAARRVAPDEFLIGLSTDDSEIACDAVAQGADYIGCGAVYPTSNKRDVGEVIGLKGLRHIVQAVPVPVVGIGGVTIDRAGDIYATGAAGIAVIGSVMGAENATEAVRKLLGAADHRI